MRNFSLIFLIIFFTINCTLNAQSGDKNKDLSNQKELLDSGLNKVKENNFEAALKDFDMAIELNPSSNLAHEIFFERAQIKRKEFKKFNSALEDYNLAIELNPSYVKAYMYRSILNERNFKNDSKALEDVKKSIEIDSSCGACWMQLGYSNQISFEEQFFALEKALELGVDIDFNGVLEPSYYLYNQIATVRIFNTDSTDEDYIESINYFQKCIDNYEEMDVDGDGEYDKAGYLENSYYMQANIYLEILNQPIIALEKINIAIEINPLNKDFHVLKSKIYYKMDEIDNAIKSYNISKKIKPKLYYNDYFANDSSYPYIDFDRKLDSISLPIKIKAKIDLEEIMGLDTRNNQFFMSLDYFLYTQQAPLFLNYKKDTISFFDFEENKLIKPVIINSDRTEKKSLTYYGYDNVNITDDYMYYSSVKSDFFHNWDLSDYPFDTQKLQFEIKAEIDTSIVRFNESKFYKSSYNKVNGLIKGFNIDKIDFEEKFEVQNEVNTFYPGINRETVYPIASFNIEVSRSGGWLFVKLFLGSYLAFLISWIVFLIPTKEFGSRISLTVGGIFGAIGNRYFVDSSLPVVQVLTKADIINNLILLLLIFNILIVIYQKNKKNSLRFINNKTAMLYSGILFVVLNLIIILI
jgi:tetratricopeptide (TPR) repeat protein